MPCVATHLKPIFIKKHGTWHVRIAWLASQPNRSNKVSNNVTCNSMWTRCIREWLVVPHDERWERVLELRRASKKQRHNERDNTLAAPYSKSDHTDLTVAKKEEALAVVSRPYSSSTINDYLVGKLSSSSSPDRSWEWERREMSVLILLLLFSSNSFDCVTWSMRGLLVFFFQIRLICRRNGRRNQSIDRRGRSMHGFSTRRCRRSRQDNNRHIWLWKQHTSSLFDSTEEIPRAYPSTTESEKSSFAAHIEHLCLLLMWNNWNATESTRTYDKYTRLSCGYGTDKDRPRSYRSAFERYRRTNHIRIESVIRWPIDYTCTMAKDESQSIAKPYGLPLFSTWYPTSKVYDQSLSLSLFLSFCLLKRRRISHFIHLWSAVMV